MGCKVNVEAKGGHFMDKFVNIAKGKTVYFFGAGASHASDFELPCLKDFFKACFKPDEYPNLYQFITPHVAGSPTRSPLFLRGSKESYA